jgi:hypothetical protein
MGSSESGLNKAVRDSTDTVRETDTEDDGNLKSPHHRAPMIQTETTPSRTTPTLPPRDNSNSKPTQPYPQTTGQSFPASMYDTPGHAIAAGLFIGTAGTALFWVVAFILKVYATWIWRSLTGIARGLEPLPLDRVLIQGGNQ